MEEFTFTVTLKVKATALDKEDAKTLVLDYVGPGPMEDCLEIVSAKIV